MDSSTQVKRYADMVWRQKWWIVVPTMLAVAASIMTTPKIYHATTTILMTQQSVPENIVHSTVTLRLEERMRSLQVQLLSRAYLERIVKEFKMVPADANDAEVDQSCRKLGARISTDFDTRDYSWLKISVDDGDAQRAAGIANRLAGLFLEENSRMRASQAAGTLEATGSWVSTYRVELEKRDAKISEFKQQNFDALPEQQQVNEQFLADAQNQFTQLGNEIRARNDRLAALRASQQLAPAKSSATESDDARLAGYQRELADLLERYTENHPLVKRKREQIASFMRSPVPAATTVAPTDPAVGPTSVSAQIASIEDDIKALARDRARESAKIESYRARLERAPQVREKLVALTREGDRVHQQYDTAVAQTEQAQHSQDLEGSNPGQQFQILDRAYPATVPNRPNFSFAVAIIALGVAIGAGLAALREFIHPTVRSEDEFVAEFPDLPVYGVIPNLDVKLKSRRLA